MSTEILSATNGSCKCCGRGWPIVKFSLGQDMVCDSCLVNTAKKINAVVGHQQNGLMRKVEVSGIVSRTNVIGFHYATHSGLEERVFTTLHVTFKNDRKYVYQDVPVAVCEAWYMALSKGEYFAEFIRSSYKCARVI